MVHPCVSSNQHKHLAPVVQTMGSTIHRINHNLFDSAILVLLLLIPWILIYPADNTIPHVNNWGLEFTL